MSATVVTTGLTTGFKALYAIVNGNINPANIEPKIVLSLSPGAGGGGTNLPGPRSAPGKHASKNPTPLRKRVVPLSKIDRGYTFAAIKSLIPQHIAISGGIPNKNIPGININSCTKNAQ